MLDRLRSWRSGRPREPKPKQLVAPNVRFDRIAADVEARATNVATRTDAVLAQIEATQKAASTRN